MSKNEFQSINLELCIKDEALAVYVWHLFDAQPGSDQVLAFGKEISAGPSYRKAFENARKILYYNNTTSPLWRELDNACARRGLDPRAFRLKPTAPDKIGCRPVTYSETGVNIDGEASITLEEMEAMVKRVKEAKT